MAKASGRNALFNSERGLLVANFFIWSESGDGAFMGERLMREQHKARIYLHHRQAKDTYKGIIPHAISPSPRRDEVVIFDMVGNGKKADQMRSSGYMVIGASELSDRIELDRGFGLELMKKVGIRVPEYQVFNKISDGIKFLYGKSEKWYYKPYGNQNTGDTFDGHREDLARFMESAEKPDKFLLQKEVKGTEISLEGIFNGKDFVYPFNSTFEDKKLMVGNKGPRTGCMANIVFNYDDPHTPLAKRTVFRLRDILKGIVTPMDLNMIVDSQGDPWGLEWSPRFGYHAWPAMTMLIKGDLGEQLEKLAQGKLESWNVDTGELALAIGVSVPPYPHWELGHTSKGKLLNPELRSDPDSVLLGDVMLDSKGRLAVQGMDCCVAVVGETGDDVPSMRKRVLEKAESYRIPSAIYRTDPVTRWEESTAKLRRMGYDTFKPRMERKTFDVGEPIQNQPG